MKDCIVESARPVLLVGGGDCPADLLRVALAQSDRVVAADGGAAHVLAQGRLPDAVIGDLDSLDAATLARIPTDRLHRIADQESTDFDKALRHVRAPLVRAHGFLGARVDHQMAAMTVLVRRAAQRAILTGREDAVVLCPPDLRLDLAPGTRVSLFPMGPVGGRSRGLRWPIDGLDFAPAGIIGTSNEALGPVALRMDRPAMLLILPVDALDALEAGLDAAAAWPARAE